MSSKTVNVEQYLLGKIRSGEFPMYGCIPSQHRLMASLACSRITVQRAIKNLTREGFLRSEKGRGTFVLPRQAARRLSEIIIISKYRENSPNYPFTEMLFSLDTRGVPTRWLDYDFIARHEHVFSTGQAVLWLLPAENQIMTMHHLDNLGIHDIRFAENGEVAVKVMNEWIPDLVLTDMWMPKMDGTQLAEAMRRDRRLAEIPVVAVTADVDVGSTYDMSLFAKIISKPVTTDKLKSLFGSLA